MPAITPYRTMRGHWHTGFVEGVVHPLPGGQRIITCSYNGPPKLWDLESGAQIGDDWKDEGDNVGLKTIALSPKGDMMVSGSIDGTMRLWDVKTGKVTARWRGHTSFVRCVCWSPDGERVVSGGNGGTAKIWNVNSAAPVLDLKPIKTGYESVHAVSYSPDATKIATGGFNVSIWDAKTGKRLSIFRASTFSTESTVGPAGVVRSLAWTSDGKKLISGSSGGSITIFNLNTATWLQTAVLKGHRSPVYGLALSPNDRFLVGTSEDQTVRLWNLDTKFLVGPPLQHEHSVTNAALSADGKLLSTGCADENTYVWNIHAILKASGLENLLPILDAPKIELKQKVHELSHGSSNTEDISPSESSQDLEVKSFLEADATGCPDPLGDVNQLPPGFFDDRKADAHTKFQSAATADARPNFFALRGRLSSFLRRSRPNEAIETHKPPVSLESLLNRLSSLLRSPPNTDEISELPQPPILARLSPQMLLGHLSLLLPHSRLHTDEATEPQQSPTPPGSRPGVFIGRLSSLFRSPPNTNEATELQQWSRQITSFHCSPRVVEVVAQRDKQALYVSPPPQETASDKAKRIKNPTRWVRVVLFLCCVSPGTDETHCST
ncbi:WD40-repeat-containing domain protein [Suillus clintonianus]|uniref:WD40-repeat-containing domain protein n=1 Tax=Suillus clintonianus TaxID=1904413 RepID=UPI001B886503|nr:WD40-repeat-containing domain protein [Suillus clintonianus]KAG2120269.1 WD40-repeat-containing domain protein [Suillus clintonianus]